MPNNTQVELIVDKFAAISQEYDKLEDSDIKVPDFSIDDIPIVTIEDVEEHLLKWTQTNLMLKVHIGIRLIV